MNKHGGERQGAGAPKKNPEVVKVAVNIRLPNWLNKWLNSQNVSKAVLIEEALIEKHKLKKPDIE